MLYSLDNLELTKLTKYFRLIWIWGLPFYSSSRTFVMMFPFILFSIGIIVEIALLLKSYFILKKKDTETDVVSRDWIKRGRFIIRLELLWTLWLLFFIYAYWPFGIYYIEVPIFLPLISGTMLIMAGNLSRRLDIDNDLDLHKESKFKTIHRLYIFVFILYSIFFFDIFCNLNFS